MCANAYLGEQEWEGALRAGGETRLSWSMQDSGGWYDFSLSIDELPGYLRRFAGRVETGRDSVSDPRMGLTQAE
jgi:phospholipase C